MNYSKIWTDEKLIEAVKESFSKRQVLIKLGLAPLGGNYLTITNNIKRLKIDISHFTGKGWSKNKKSSFKRPLSDYLSNEYPIHSHKLRLRLIDEKVFQPICSNCGLEKWLNDPIPLELEHKDGNPLNNSLDNLCLLCPNCHALTPTYRGKNITIKTKI